MVSDAIMIGNEEPGASCARQAFAAVETLKTTGTKTTKKR